MARPHGPLSPSAAMAPAAGRGAAELSLHERGTTHVTNQLAAPGGADMDAHRADMLAQAAATRETFATFVSATRALLRDQPSGRSVWAQARRLNAVVDEIAKDMAGGRG